MSEPDIRTILKDATACAVVTINALEQKNAELRAALEDAASSLRWIHQLSCLTIVEDPGDIQRFAGSRAKVADAALASGGKADSSQPSAVSDQPVGGIINPPDVPKRKQPYRVHAWVCPDCGGMMDRTGTRCEHCGKPRTFGGLLIWVDADEQLFIPPAAEPAGVPCPNCQECSPGRVKCDACQLFTTWACCGIVQKFNLGKCPRCGNKEPRPPEAPSADEPGGRFPDAVITAVDALAALDRCKCASIQDAAIRERLRTAIETAAEPAGAGRLDVEALAREITTDLFTAGDGEVAVRLALELDCDRDGGGLCSKAVFDRIGAKIQAALGSAAEPAGDAPDSVLDLREYVQHKYDCRCRLTTSPFAPCTCGLNDVLKPAAEPAGVVDAQCATCGWRGSSDDYDFADEDDEDCEAGPRCPSCGGVDIATKTGIGASWPAEPPVPPEARSPQPEADKCTCSCERAWLIRGPHHSSNCAIYSLGESPESEAADSEAAAEPAGRCARCDQAIEGAFLALPSGGKMCRKCHIDTEPAAENDMSDCDCKKCAIHHSEWYEVLSAMFVNQSTEPLPAAWVRAALPSERWWMYHQGNLTRVYRVYS